MSGRSVPFLLAVVLIAAPNAQALPIVDQSFMPGLNASELFRGDVQLAQTFRVGVSGLMTGIDLSLDPSHAPVATGNLLISILPTNAGIPHSKNALAFDTVVVPASYLAPQGTPSPDSYRHIAFTPFAVNAGDLLAISVRQARFDLVLLGFHEGFDAFNWHGGGTASPYSEGYPYRRTASFYGGLQPWTVLSGGLDGWDFAFQTYVNPASVAPPPTVPEPAPALLVAWGLATLLARKRQRERGSRRA